MKISITALLASIVLAAAPRKAEAGILEGALIGAGIGAVVGVTMSLFQDAPKDTAAAIKPAPSDSTSTAKAPDTTAPAR